MIYKHPAVDEPLDQGDLIDGCPILNIERIQFGQPSPIDVGFNFRRIVIMTQTCDVANEKTKSANVAEVIEAQDLVAQGILKPADIKGPLRSGRVWGMYFLPAFADLGLNEMIVDLRRLHTVRIDILATLCLAGKRRARLETPYREHLAKRFADTFCRIGLPQPYETL